MAVSQELLDILVCPLDKTPVKLTSDQHGLKCPSCRRVYPIREDIPVMLVDEASIATE
ncbi:MAG: Trm112 family protein [Candidatus Acidiferrales bacterium]